MGALGVLKSIRRRANGVWKGEAREKSRLAGMGGGAAIGVLQS